MTTSAVTSLGGQDSLLFLFDGAVADLTDIQASLTPFVQSLEDYSDGWMPDLVRGKRQGKYSRQALWKALADRRDASHTTCALYRTVSPKVELTLTLWLPPHPTELGAFLEVEPIDLFSDVERSRKFIEMVRAWALRYPVVSHAYAHSTADGELSGAPYYGREERLGRKNGFDQIYAVYWLNLFGPKLVEAVGRERMRSTPAHRVEELPDGSILLVTWPTAADFASEAARVAQARAWVHLRPDLDFDTVMATMRERSATLAPVEPHFAPDVAALLARLPEYASLGRRQQRIAELNTYVPPEPDEWLPLNAALPTDVADPKAALEQYAYFAERLVALLHTPVPSVFKMSPESLTDIDLHFWKETFPDTFERHNIDAIAVPAVGAYLGEVLVKHLGGQWIPRRQWMEAQVRVGDRVWLPFVRAHRYMRSTQALLDHSLTQLYRVAERHAY